MTTGVLRRLTMKLGQLESLLLDAAQGTSLVVRNREYDVQKYLDEAPMNQIAWESSSKQPVMRRFFSSVDSNRRESITGEYFFNVPSNFYFPKSDESTTSAIDAELYGEMLNVEVTEGDMDGIGLLHIYHNLDGPGIIGINAITDAELPNQGVRHDDLSKSIILARSFLTHDGQSIAVCKEKLTENLRKLIKGLK